MIGTGLRCRRERGARIPGVGEASLLIGNQVSLVFRYQRLTIDTGITDISGTDLKHPPSRTDADLPLGNAQPLGVDQLDRGEDRNLQ